MKLVSSLFAAILIVFFLSPALHAGGRPEAAFAYALALASAEKDAAVDPEVMRMLQSLSDKIDALDKKIDAKALKSTQAAGNATNPNCTCPSCGCGLLCTCDASGNCSCAACGPKSSNSSTQQVCSIVGYDRYGRAITSCAQTQPNATSAGIAFSSPVTSYAYSTPVYSSYSYGAPTVWSDGTVTYDAPAGRARRCGPIRRLLGLCQ
jgi:hypothetical protein